MFRDITEFIIGGLISVPLAMIVVSFMKCEGLRLAFFDVLPTAIYMIVIFIVFEAASAYRNMRERENLRR